jgi:hypothetical protein
LAKTQKLAEEEAAGMSRNIGSKSQMSQNRYITPLKRLTKTTDQVQSFKAILNHPSQSSLSPPPAGHPPMNDFSNMLDNQKLRIDDYMKHSQLHGVMYPPHFNHTKKLQQRYKQKLDMQVQLGTDTMDLNPYKKQLN